MIDLERGLRELIREVVREELAKLEEVREPSPMLSVVEAAELARVTPATIRRWCKEGRLIEHRAGRVVRVRRVDLENLLARSSRRRDRLEDLSDAEIDAMAARISG